MTVSKVDCINNGKARQAQGAVHALQDNARQLSDLSRAEGDLHKVQEEVRGLRQLKDELGFAQRRTEDLDRRLVEQEVAVQQLSASNEQLQAKVHELTTAKQQLELALTAAKWASPSFPDTSNDMMCSGDRHDKNQKELHGRVQT